MERSCRVLKDLGGCYGSLCRINVTLFQKQIKENEQNVKYAHDWYVFLLFVHFKKK
jgi:hypothetical protein